MKSNKGFTLIEMIGIIILLAVIMLVVAPSMISTLKNTNTKTFENFKSNLKIAVENYIVDNKKTNESSIIVNLNTLLDNDYIDEIPSIPKDDPMAEGGTITEIPGTAEVTATKTSTGYTYKICKYGSATANKCFDL